MTDLKLEVGKKYKIGLNFIVEIINLDVHYLVEDIFTKNRSYFSKEELLKLGIQEHKEPEEEFFPCETKEYLYGNKELHLYCCEVNLKNPNKDFNYATFCFVEDKDNEFSSFITLKRPDFCKLKLYKKESKVIELKNEKAWFGSAEDYEAPDMFLDCKLNLLGRSCGGLVSKKSFINNRNDKKYRLEIYDGAIFDEGE